MSKNYEPALKPSLGDLHDALFDQIDRLSDPDCKGDALDAEIRRTKAVNDVAGRIVDVARVQVAAYEAAGRHGQIPANVSPPLLAAPSTTPTRRNGAA